MKNWQVLAKQIANLKERILNYCKNSKKKGPMPRKVLSRFANTFVEIKKLGCILDFERSRNQRQGSEFFLGKWIL